MFLKLWNYIRGYVIIKLWGFSPTRFLNLCTNKNIFIWDVCKKSDYIEMKVSIKGFKSIKHCVKKTKCRVKIINKCGLPFIFHRYRKRKTIVLGIIIFFSIILYFSSFIWVLDIQGNNRIKTDEIITYLKGINIDVGSYKKSIDVKELENNLRNKFSDISWVAVEINGTKLFINIVEIIEKPIFFDKSIPCNTVSKKDALIHSIATNLGTPIVSKGDIVRQGEVLVSGELDLIADDGSINKEYVYSDAKIMGKILYNIDYKLPLLYKEKFYTEEEKFKYGLIFMDKDIFILGNKKPYEYYDTIRQNYILKINKNFVLPFGITRYNYIEYKYRKKEYSEEKAKEISKNEVYNILNDKIEEEYSIEYEDFNFYIENDILYTESEILTLERIDEKIQINAEWSDSLNATN